MIQPSPTPGPDHGTGWGLLLLFVYLYGVVALLGVGSAVAIVANRYGRRLPRAANYLVVIVLAGALAIAGFAVLVSAAAGMFDVVALLAIVVFLPLAVVVANHRESADGRLATVARAALAWGPPFLVGFGLLAVVGSGGGAIPPLATGALAAVVVLAGTVLFDRVALDPASGRARE